MYGQGYGVPLGEEILEAMQGYIKVKIFKDRIIEKNIEEIIGMRVMTEKEVGVGLEKEHILTIIKEEQE